MEEFAPVLWIVIIVGLMIFNVVSQSRKARKKGAGQVPHGEAWPTTASEESLEHAEKPGRTAYQPVTPVYPDESQSLEEIPAREYEPEYTTLKSTDTGALRHQTTDRLKTAPERDEIAAGAISDAPEETASSIAEEFDLRQAVIYSEILKPRFEERN